MDSDGNARRVTQCRVCGQEDWQDVISLGSAPLANSYLEPADSYDDEPYYPLGVISCRSCRLMSLTHVVDPEKLFRNYSYITSGSEMMTLHMRQVVVACRDRYGLVPGDLIVEMGSNTGTQLMAFQKEGMRTLGMDPARNLAAVANERGIETLPEFFSTGTAKLVRKKYGPARLILGRHVFAHIDDVAEIISGVLELLTRDGVFAIEVQYLIDLLDKVAFDTIYHEHLSYFAVGPLARLFKERGLRILDVVNATVHGGSILVFAGHDNGPWRQSSTVDKILALEDHAGLYTEATYHRFADNIEKVASELCSLIHGLTAKEMRVAGYGAPAKGNTLLNFCNLGPRDLEYCSDTTTLKQGRVLPGTHIPIRTPEYAAANPPDYYVLLAWNYADEILHKEARFIECGGRFIVPIPKPSIAPSDPL